MTATTTTSDTRHRILDVSERLLQTRGFNGVSYADIAAELGITKAALHYHFPAKTDLGLAVLERYAGSFAAALCDIDDRHPRAVDRLRAYAALYVDVLEGERLCLCAMLAAEQRTLDPSLRRAVDAFFAANVVWLTALVRQGRRDGTVAGVGSPGAVADLVLGALEGALLVAWSRDDLEGFRRTTRQLVASLTPAR
jgi:TetR/AcrR family transcriptional repressor of nem operon